MIIYKKYEREKHTHTEYWWHIASTVLCIMYLAISMGLPNEHLTVLLKYADYFNPDSKASATHAWEDQPVH